MWCFRDCFLFFFFFSERFIYYSVSECTKLVSCAYYVGGSFYMILCVLYKNWGVLNITVFSIIAIFLLFVVVFFDVQYFSFRTLYT